VHNPELLLLDEPFSGLDPVNTHIIKKVLNMLVKNGCYIILSAHQMHIVEEFCEDILILDKGNAVLQGKLPEIKHSYDKHHALIKTTTDISNLLQSDIKIEQQISNSYKLKFSNIQEINALLGTLLAENVYISKFEILEPSLEEIFVEKVGKI